MSQSRHAEREAFFDHDVLVYLASSAGARANPQSARAGRYSQLLSDS